MIRSGDEELLFYRSAFPVSRQCQFYITQMSISYHSRTERR